MTKHQLVLNLSTLKFAILFSAVYFFVYLAGQYSFLNISIENSHTGNLSVYWKSKTMNSLSENSKVSVRVNNRKNNYWLILPVKLSEIDRLRLDPTDRSGVESFIRALRVYSLTSRPVIIGDRQSFSRLQANHQVSELDVSDNYIYFKSDGIDSNFLLEVSRQETYKYLFLRLIFSAILCLVILGLFRVKSAISAELRFVPYCMASVAVLIITMSAISKKYVHPDEITHVNNAVYYSQHITPAVACSQETRFTYSNYGISRLDKREIAYYLEGQILHLVDSIPLETVVKLRSLDCVLFLILTFLAFKYIPFRYIVLPILLTPQAWYLFSYYNSDALSLFVAFLTGFQVFEPESMFRKLLRGEYVNALGIKLVFFTLLVAMQFWVKANFFFYILFLGFAGFSWVAATRTIPKVKLTLPLVTVLVCGVALYGGWELWRHSVNDFQLAQKAAECRELMADTLHKPSTPLEKTHATFRLRDKGVPLWDLVEKHNWLKNIVYTSLGAYGYLEYMSGSLHYNLDCFFIMIFVGYVSTMILVRGNNFDRLLLLSGFVAIMGLLMAAALNSWQSDLQAQGRYLLVYLPIIGSLLLSNKQKLNTGILFYASMFPFLLGLFSFIFVGLMEIPKT